VKVLYRESDGAPVQPDPAEELGAGGQARVVGVAGNPAWVVKLYHQPAEQHARKLRVMLAHPPLAALEGEEPAARPALVWPADLLRDEEGRTVGLLMRRVSGMQRAFELYNPATRRVRSPHFDYARLHRAARNVAAAFAALHAAGYVVGDANESNVLVDDEGNVTVIDTDSFQVRDPATGEVFRCPVGRPEFAPPELQGRTLSEVDRTPEHDRFALGVLVFQLLMEGTHPFAGRWPGPGEPPPVPERIARGLFPYTPGGEVNPPRNAPPIDLLHPLLRGAFRRCFEVGHADPGARPQAHEWVAVLEAAQAALVPCGANPAHRYGGHLAACPWCERARALGGRDPFPTREAVARGEHLAVAPRWRGPAAGGSPARHRRFAGLSGSVSFPGAVSPGVWGAGLFVASAVALVSSMPALLVFALAATCVVRAIRAMRTSEPLALALIVLALVLGMTGVVRASGLRERDAGTYAEPTTASAPDPLPPEAESAFEAADLSRPPRPLQPEKVAQAAGLLHSAEMAANSSRAITFLRFEVGSDGRVDRRTINFFEGAPNALGTRQAAELLSGVPFRPAEIDGRPVRARAELPLIWDNGRAKLLVEDASWADDDFMTANPDLAETPRPVHLPEAAPGALLTTAESEAAFQRTLQREYPPDLREAGAGGVVMLRFVVGQGGRVRPGSVRASTDADPRFSVVAARALDSLRFTPSSPQPHLEPAWVTLPVVFRSEGASAAGEQRYVVDGTVVTREPDGTVRVTGPDGRIRILRGGTVRLDRGDAAAFD
jgi:TonB family protein